MHGATLKGKPYYRCNTQRPDHADTGEHPTTTAVREEHILEALDRVLAAIRAGMDPELATKTTRKIQSRSLQPRPPSPAGTSTSTDLHRLPPRTPSR